MRPPRILIVDDNEFNLELFTDVLEGAGYHLSQARDAETAIEMARREQPDLILMDLSLPGIDGFEATRRLKQDPSTACIPILAVTAHAMRGDDERALLAGCQGYISKPIDVRIFPLDVRRYLSGMREQSP
ncbi:MAG: response regulator [Armatimonadetes bacterium]|nr:response regulator [Armatimonadota bacterium]